MDILELIGEQRINEAVERGDGEHLACAGQPLDLEENLLVPVEQRMAFRILKNAYYIPPELETRKEAVELAMALVEEPDNDAFERGRRKLALLNHRLSAAGLPPVTLDERYGAALLENLSR
ncbi:DUF1992 domain-containing protein [Paludibacterium sp. dN 18-1]|uniref:DUF1992 domain-containing protein n=2 Tax=Paludibacterium denitrificans TaxID=2675226 RepID=A0A844GDI2_9NEIS|nr:DUF1992 domain-containing protein [Paludibacterium denitrificans]